MKDLSTREWSTLGTKASGAYAITIIVLVRKFISICEADICSSWRYHGSTPGRYIKQVKIGANNEYCGSCFTGQYTSFWLTSWCHGVGDWDIVHTRAYGVEYTWQKVSFSLQPTFYIVRSHFISSLCFQHIRGHCIITTTLWSMETMIWKNTAESHLRVGRRP